MSYPGMSETVIQFPGNTIVDQPPSVMLEKAKDWGMTKCVIIGFDERGEIRFGGSFSDAGEMLLLLEAARRLVLDTVLP